GWAAESSKSRHIPNQEGSAGGGASVPSAFSPASGRNPLGHAVRTCDNYGLRRPNPTPSRARAPRVTPMSGSRPSDSEPPLDRDADAVSPPIQAANGSGSARPT